ncbi:hypothetical protein WJX81_008087 [Elliptochloris bilobata]|uniref:Arrestin C-terminal-like domain-containing protein n=1 Tax=Elliptochloris bilobata TaxID=381761 RepID=A0AAW1SIK9_9CHLO
MVAWVIARQTTQARLPCCTSGGMEAPVEMHLELAHPGRKCCPGDLIEALLYVKFNQTVKPVDLKVQIVGGVRVAWTEKKANRAGSTLVTCWLVPAKSYEHRAIRLPHLMSDGTSFCSLEGRVIYYLQAVMRCEIDKQSWPQEVKVQEEVFVTAPTPPDYLCPLEISSAKVPRAPSDSLGAQTVTLDVCLARTAWQPGETVQVHYYVRNGAASVAFTHLHVCLWRLLRLHAEVREDEEWRAPSGKDITDLQSRKFSHQKLFMHSIKLEAPVRPGGTEAGILVAKGQESSSCDENTQQGINRTLHLDNSFWSSTGSGPQHNEYLLYRLRAPLCHVQYVRIAVFRAHFHLGAPIYPPERVSFEVGATPHTLCEVEGGSFPVRATARWQTFAVPANACIGQYLRVNLLGKRQRQQQDMQWYTAVCAVAAHGRAPPAPLPALAPWRLHALPHLQLVKGYGVAACAATRLLVAGYLQNLFSYL